MPEQKTFWPEGRAEKFTSLANELAQLVALKNVAYGDTANRAGKMLEALYPKGVQPHQYTDMLLIVRIIDKLSRIAQRDASGRDPGGESPYRDIMGYGLLGWEKESK